MTRRVIRRKPCKPYRQYGTRTRKGRPFIGHRLAYVVLWERVHGPVPEGYVLHHTCEHKWCVEITHLELVTPVEHGRLHFTPEWQSKGHDVNRSKTHCPQGHEYTPENTYVNPLTGYRRCKRCHANREWMRKYGSK